VEFDNFIFHEIEVWVRESHGEALHSLRKAKTSKVLKLLDESEKWF